jgi:drug/metabolite transporter (DMT)-like permease
LTGATLQALVSSTAVALRLTFAALSRIGASHTAVVMTLEAVSTVLLAGFLLGESISVGQACGGLAIVGAAAVLARSRAGGSSADREVVLQPGLSPASSG